MLASLSLKASASNVYATQDINHNDCIYDNALNNKADTSNTYLKTEIDTKCAALPAYSVELRGIFRLSKSSGNITFPIDRYSLSLVTYTMVWMSLVSIEYNVDSMICRLIVDKHDIVDEINNNSDNTSGNASMGINKILS